jgi:hypothetical protein
MEVLSCDLAEVGAGKPQTSIIRAGVSAGIRTQYLQNTKYLFVESFRSQISLYTQLYMYSVHCARLLHVQNILSADTGISRQTEGHSFDDHLISGSVSVTPSSVTKACALFCVFMSRVSQCPISLRLHIK